MRKNKFTIIISCVFIGLLALILSSIFEMTDSRPWAERKVAVDKLAKEGDVLCNAIAQYKEVMGRYPENLSELMPDYLQSLPSVEVEGLRHHGFVYALASDDSDFKGYELSVLTPRFFINWDELFYWPSENYPDLLYDQRVEAIGGWAYLHE